MNIPGCATKIIDFAVSLLSDKLKARVLVSIDVLHLRFFIPRSGATLTRFFLFKYSSQVYKNPDDLKEAINPKILPKEYGGEIPLADMVGKSGIFRFIGSI